MRNTEETVHILVGDLELEIVGTYHPAMDATMCAYGWDPPEPAGFVIDSIRVDGRDLTGDEEEEIRKTCDIEALCLEEIGERDDSNTC